MSNSAKGSQLTKVRFKTCSIGFRYRREHSEKREKKVAAHMTRLTRGEVKYEWGGPCERAFQKLKRRLTSAYVMKVPERGQGYTMCCDASNNGLGCVLMQSGRVVAYGSQQLKNHEQNYPIHDMELVTISYALRSWHH